MRLFVAVDLDDTARVAIAAEQQRVAAAIGESRSSVRWAHADHLHLTLVFLGEVPDEHAKAIGDAVGRPVDAPPFPMTLQGLGVFPPHGSPRAIWIGVTGGSEALVDLQHTLARRVAAEGMTLETRPFRPQDRNRKTPARQSGPGC